MIVSRQTVYRRLGHIGLYARSPVRCAPPHRNSLSPAINLRSREHALWTPQQWSCVMFSDEFRFICSLILVTLIWRTPGAVTTKRTQRHRYGGAGMARLGRNYS
ncbi:HTH_Tnp_Tc3_2 domain-containing protein [Trichonephila clavipes]|nr:HTH_Tnp_Tc3_2 domain-containing protein [Trichonephila clavipes]